MILGSADGTVFTLTPVGYEYDLDHPGVAEEDLAWLVVEGSVVLADGSSWTFRDPCLTIEDAVDLGDWLHGSEPDLGFVEPVLAFTSEDVGERVQVTVWMGYSALPPWSPEALEGEGPELYPVRLDVAPEQLVAAAATWREACAAFPARRVPGRGWRRLLGR